MKNRVGFVVGKFTPFHLGHKYLIDTALENSDYVYVLPYSNPDLGLSQTERVLQLIEHYRTNENLFVVSPVGNLPTNDSPDFVHRRFCAVELFRYIATRNIILRDSLKFPDTVFSSEEYGYGFADDLSNVFGKTVSHWCVDMKREKYPISGTLIRQGGYDEWKA